MAKELRDYQADITKKVINSDLDLIVCLPTGAGKTVIANALMEQLDGLKIFVVPRLELIKQANDEFGDVDIIWSDKTQITGKNIIISSKDSLRTQLNKIPDVHPLTLIFDEVHIGIEQTFKLVDAIKPDRVLGLTATPERMDGLALTKGADSLHKFGVFDDVLIAETVPTLINKGYLTPLSYYTKPIDGIVKMRPDSAASEELSGTQMMRLFDKNEIWGDIVQCYEKYNPDKKPSIGFTTTIEMAETVCKLFKDAGYDFRVISGEMNISERRKLLDMLKNGEIHGLVNAALLTYGFDCPEVYYAFSCRHIKSRPLWFQMVGRVLRIHESKDKAIFVDHGDSISEFTQPGCALPILDPLIQWQYDGVSKEMKRAQKVKRDQANEVIRMINDLDPQPVDMVEVTPEDLFVRLVKVYNKISKELGSMRNVLAEAKKQALAANERAQKMKEEKDKLIVENQKLRARKSGPVKVIDREKTFDYIRKNYCNRRRRFEKNNTKIQAHEMTVRSLLADESILPFYYDRATFDNSMRYWKTRIDKEGLK